jgi:N-acetylglucosamine-6-phosphate deacetylase
MEKREGSVAMGKDAELVLLNQEGEGNATWGAGKRFHREGAGIA